MRSTCNCWANRKTHDDISSDYANFAAPLLRRPGRKHHAERLRTAARRRRDLVGTSLMVTDRRTSGAQVEDQAIELKAKV